MPEFPNGTDDAHNYQEEVATALAAWWPVAAHRMSQTATLEHLKCNNVGANGRYTDAGNTNVHVFPANLVGGAPPVQPSFCTVAWSWVTDRARGRGAKGRMYPPNFVIGDVGSAFLTTGEQNAQLQAAMSLLAVFRNIGGLWNGAVGVFSSLDASWNPIQGARVGNVIDTQRRRKNAYNESYVQALAHIDYTAQFGGPNSAPPGPGTPG